MSWVYPSHGDGGHMIRKVYEAMNDEVAGRISMGKIEAELRTWLKEQGQDVKRYSS